MTRRRPRRLVIALALVFASSSLAACGSDSDGVVLTYYINPDPNPPADYDGPFGQRGIVARCNEQADGYRIEVEELPGDATQQRIQLARRLAADDPAIDIMTLDPVFTGEFADAGFLAEIPPDQQESLADGILDGALESARWENELVVAPQWANTQVLWYRKSLAEAAGLDMSEPVTWGQIIEAAAENGGSVGVQANKYEGYVVLINALIKGAGGDIVTDTEEGLDATVAIDSEAGRAAAEVLQMLADSAAAQSDLSVSNEGTVLPYMFADGSAGEFMTNWTFTYANYQGAGDVTEEEFEDLGWARYPRTIPDQESRPPLGGINLGVNSSSDNVDEALEAIECMTSVDNQVQYAIDTGNMPAAGAGYEAPELLETFPEDLLALYRESVDAAGPRPITPYYSDISSAIQSTWHPASSVDESTPEDSAEFIRAVLDGEALL